jgi:flagellar motility protein MotE (MotC chaperone)
MHDVKTMSAAALLLAAAFAAAACGRSKSEPDPAALDAHFNKMIAEDEAERRRLVEAARDREDVRNKEMEQRAQNYRDKAD